jgi:LmbE family N-acetylglucosaminyl deacetylase
MAHPDDETLGSGGTLARYAAEGVEVTLLTATRGERGWFGIPEVNPGLAEMGRLREIELRCAAAVLGIGEVHFLDYIDGDLDQADPAEAIARIAEHVRRTRPDVVITFDPFGAYGHPDHIAISQFTTAALIAAADPSILNLPGEPHRVAKLYYMVERADLMPIYEKHFGVLQMNIDGVTRTNVAWPDWSITTVLDTRDYWDQVWEAVTCHRTQLPGYGELVNLPPDVHQELWGVQTYYRAVSFVNGGRTQEDDLFAGLR